MLSVHFSVRYCNLSFLVFVIPADKRNVHFMSLTFTSFSIFFLFQSMTKPNILLGMEGIRVLCNNVPP